MDQIFQIGDFCFRLICRDGIVPPKNFMRFSRKLGEAEYTYTLEYADIFPQVEGIPAMIRPDFQIFRNDSLETRYLGIRGVPGWHACYREETENSARVFLKPDIRHLDVDPMFVSLLALERRMNDREGLVLHCAYLEYQGGAILFSAPSGTGKSTQAGLWEQYRGGITVNGDRCLLQRINGQWHARGWPVCGSSGICVNRDTPVRTIVMLSQSETDSVERLSPLRSFSQLYPQVTVNSWNRQAQQRAMDFLEQLIAEIPVYHLNCTISECAVVVLEEKMRNDLLSVNSNWK